METAAALIAVLASASAAYALERTSSVPQSPDAVAVAVLAPRGTEGERLSVCMHPGAGPREYPLLSVSCRDGADRCTAFVSVSRQEAEFILPTYDLERPPVASAQGRCDGLPFQPTGVLSRPTR